MVWVLLLTVSHVGVWADDGLPVAPEIAPDVVNFSTPPFKNPWTKSGPSLNLHTTGPSISFSISVPMPSLPPPIGSTPAFMAPFAALSLFACARMIVYLHIARRRYVAVARSSSQKQLSHFTALLATTMFSVIAGSAVAINLVQSPRLQTKWVAGPLVLSPIIVSAFLLLFLAALFLARRELRGFFAMSSVILLALTISLWVRSYRAAEWIERTTETPRQMNIARNAVRFTSNSGGFRISVESSPWPLPQAPHVAPAIDSGWYLNKESEEGDYASRYSGGAKDWNSLGFALHKDSGPGIAPSSVQWQFQLVAPYWCLTSIFLILPALWLSRRYRRMMRVAQNLCPLCAYDLRATPNQCPECGAVQA